MPRPTRPNGQIGHDARRIYGYRHRRNTPLIEFCNQACCTIDVPDDTFDLRGPLHMGPLSVYRKMEKRKESYLTRGNGIRSKVGPRRRKILCQEMVSRKVKIRSANWRAAMETTPTWHIEQSKHSR